MYGRGSKGIVATLSASRRVLQVRSCTVYCIGLGASGNVDGPAGAGLAVREGAIEVIVCFGVLSGIVVCVAWVAAETYKVDATKC